MTRSPILKLAALISLAMVARAGVAADVPATADVPASQAAAETLESLDEIWIRGKRLSEVIEKAEDDFFALYNKVNKNSQYDVFCGRMALNSGSMIMVRGCAPGFVVYNSYDVVRNTVSYSYDGSCRAYDTWSCMGGGAASYPQIPTELLLMEKRPAYAKNVLKVVSSDPRLVEMVKGLGTLYDEMDLEQRHYVTVKDATMPAKRSRKSNRFPSRTSPR